MSFTEGYTYMEFIVTLLKSVALEGPDSKFNKVCELAHSDYAGDNACAYNIARAFSDTKVFLEMNVSKDKDDWKWSNVHVISWSHSLWSSTILKPFYHREVHTGGNTNTVNVAKYKHSTNVDSPVISSYHSPNLRHIVQFSGDSSTNVSYFSIDTGQNENPLSGNYFSMNEDHLNGNMLPVRFGDQLNEEETYTL